MNDELSRVLENCWQLLQRGAVDKKSPLHTPVIGTSSQMGVQMRTVVLRKTNIDQRQLFFYTDIRSAKIDQLKANSSLNWLFYHPKKNCQIRANGQVIIHHQDNLALEKWQTLPYYGRKTYGTILSPATSIPKANDNLPPIWKEDAIELADTEYAYANFAVVVCDIHQLEWLALQRSGHQRAQFSFIHSEWEGNWMVP